MPSQTIILRPPERLLYHLTIIVLLASVIASNLNKSPLPANVYYCEIVGVGKVRIIGK